MKFLAVSVVAVAFFSTPSFAQPLQSLFNDAIGSQRRMATSIEENPTIIRSRLVGINFDILSGSTQRKLGREAESKQTNVIRLNLFDDASYYAVLDKLEESHTGKRLTWFGYIENMRHGQVILVISGNIVSGHITTDDGNLYEIRYLGGGVHSLREIDQSKFPPIKSIPVYLDDTLPEK